MIKEITITVQPNEEKNLGLHKSLVLKELKKNRIPVTGGKIDANGKNSSSPDINLVFIKKSIDARHGQIKLHLRYKVYIGEKPTDTQNFIPKWKTVSTIGNAPSVIIIGSGPAGLFGALKLLERGIKPIIIERGAQTSQRRKDIAQISTKNVVNADSNYCFGEGGAGTFSDGKLYTRSNKRGDISEILKIFNYFGADEKILTDAHPHIGTDRLPKVINAMREKIIELGGEFYFNTKVTDLLTEQITNHNDDSKPSSTKNTLHSTASLQIIGVQTENTLDGSKKTFSAKKVLLATGHSATDIYMMIAKIAPSALEAKTFAMGVRVEHPRTLIDAIQFHGDLNNSLGAAEYRVTTQVEDRGVYSFCMCPGGFVVPSSSKSDEIVVNGMSTAARNSKWSNAALVVEVRPEDIPEKFCKQADEMQCPQIAGLLYRTENEKKAFQNGKGQSAPAQRMKDFIENKKSLDLPETSYTPGVVSSNLNSWLPSHICTRLAQGFKNINKNMKGFLCNDALLIAAETRTSTPVRIVRNKETFECVAISGLYPVGEGSGYSGGIVSSAMDGVNACEGILPIGK